MSVHFEQSSYREKLLEHLFIGEVLRCLWRQGSASAEVLRPEVDKGGYDLVMGCGSVTRHIQLKSSHAGSSTSSQNIHLRLAGKPSGCVVWMFFDLETLEPGPYLWFGGAPGEALPDIDAFPRARHTKANAQGEKAQRPDLRKVGKAAFEPVSSMNALVEKLFGEVGGASTDNLGPVAGSSH